MSSELIDRICEDSVDKPVAPYLGICRTEEEREREDDHIAGIALTVTRAETWELLDIMATELHATIQRLNKFCSLMTEELEQIQNHFVHIETKSGRERYNEYKVE